MKTVTSSSSHKRYKAESLGRVVWSEADESMKSRPEVAGTGFLVSPALLVLVLSFGPEVKVTEIFFFQWHGSVLTVTSMLCCHLPQRMYFSFNS